MAEKGRRKTVDKWKKKKWFAIKASKLFDEKVLAETPAEKPLQLTNRTMKVTLDKLTGQRNRRDTTVHFKTLDVQGQTITTKVSKFESAKSILGRTLRRRNSKVEVVSKFPVVGGTARINLIVITARKATASQRAGIRLIVEEKMKKLHGNEFEDVVKELLLGNFSNIIFKEANKVFMVKKVMAYKASYSESK